MIDIPGFKEKCQDKWLRSKSIASASLAKLLTDVYAFIVSQIWLEG